MNEPILKISCLPPAINLTSRQDHELTGFGIIPNLKAHSMRPSPPRVSPGVYTGRTGRSRQTFQEQE